MQIGNPIVWRPVSTKPIKGANPSSEENKLTLCFFGECGTGKSTDLSLISKIYSIKYKESCKEESVVFKSAPSSKAVTTMVKVVQTGNMTLIDTPGTNDPDKKR